MLSVSRSSDSPVFFPEISTLDFFPRVLSHLTASELHQASLVSRNWCVLSLNYVKNSVPLLESFLNFLAIPVFPILKADNLFEISELMLAAREQLALILKHRTLEQLSAMKSLSQYEMKPIFFDKVFDIAKIFNPLNSYDPDKGTNDWPWEEKKKMAGKVGAASLRLGFLRCFDLAFKVVSITPDTWYSSPFLHWKNEKTALYCNFHFLVRLTCDLGAWNQVAKWKEYLKDDFKALAIIQEVKGDIHPNDVNDLWNLCITLKTGNL